MRLLCGEIEDAAGIDLKVDGVTLLRLNADGMERQAGADFNWFHDLVGSNIAVGGNGAVAQAVVSVGSFRKYNAWELPNGATDPFLDVNFFLPDGYDGSELKVTLFLFKTATATGTAVVTRARLGCVAPGSTLDLSISTGVNVTTTVGANNALFAVEHTLTPPNPASGALCHGIIQRVPTAVADDYTGSLYLIGARVEYA